MLPDPRAQKPLLQLPEGFMSALRQPLLSFRSREYNLTKRLHQVNRTVRNPIESKHFLSFEFFISATASVKPGRYSFPNVNPIVSLAISSLVCKLMTLDNVSTHVFV